MGTNIVRKTNRLSILSALLLAVPAAAWAETVADSTATLDEVEVIGKRNEELSGRTHGYTADSSNAAGKVKVPLKDTAQSVSVVTRQQIEDQRPASISQALNYSAGAFTGLVGAATRYDYVGMRGFNDNMTDNILIDGQKLLSDSNTYSAMQIDPYFIERIDMLKGPVSATYGRAAPGGAVAATTKRPLHDSYHEINVFGGTDKQRGASFDLTDNLTENGDVSYRLTGLAKASDSQNNSQKSRRFAVAPSLSWNITPDTNLLLQAYIQNDPDGGYHSGLPASGTISSHDGFKFSRSFSDSDPGDRFRRRQNIYSYQLHHRFNDRWTGTSKFRSAEVHTRNRQTWQTGWLDNQTLSRAAGNAAEHLKSFAFDNYLNGHFQTGSVQHNVLLGSDYQHRKTLADYSYDYTNVLPINVLNPVYGSGDYPYGQYASNRTLRLRQLGFYLQDQMQWRQWHFGAGIRRDEVDTSITDRDSGAVSSDWKGGKTTWRTSALYAFDNGISPYISYSTGFNPNTYSDADGKLLKPTESRQWEAGVKYQTPGSQNLYTLALYDLKQKNVANRVINGNYYIPSGTVKSKGVELEARTQITPEWFLQAALAYNRAEFADNVEGLNGHTPYQTPKWTASLWSNYRFKNGLDVSAGIRHINGIWADHANTVKVPAYTLVDLSARYQLGALNSALKGWQTSVSVNNVFDKRYVASCAGLTYCYYGEGRNVLANVSYRW